MRSESTRAEAAEAARESAERAAAEARSSATAAAASATQAAAALAKAQDEFTGIKMQLELVVGLLVTMQIYFDVFLCRSQERCSQSMNEVVDRHLPLRERLAISTCHPGTTLPIWERGTSS